MLVPQTSKSVTTLLKIKVQFWQLPQALKCYFFNPTLFVGCLVHNFHPHTEIQYIINS